MRDFRIQPSPRTGSVLGGRYRLEGFLASGGTAEVYLARDLIEDTLVVVKQLKPDAAGHPELRARFLNEAHATERVDHPAVVRALGIEEPEGEAPFLIMEALRGEALGEYLRRTGTISVGGGVILVRQAAAALAAVHDAGIIHRDVKPDNLFLVARGDDLVELKLLDFGMAKLADERDASESTSILGTAQYMAPEQILVEPVDCRADVYGLGVVMFRLFTGHLPFEGQSPKDLLRHQLFSPVPPASWLLENIDPRLERIIERATQKNPDNRFATMREVVQALDAILGDGPEVAVPPARHVPDLYAPVTQRGRQVARHLAKDFGAYACAPPPSTAAG